MGRGREISLQGSAAERAWVSGADFEIPADEKSISANNEFFPSQLM